MEETAQIGVSWLRFSRLNELQELWRIVFFHEEGMIAKLWSAWLVRFRLDVSSYATRRTKNQEPNRSHDLRELGVLGYASGGPASPRTRDFAHAPFALQLST
jgi:hypothetical protein